MRILKDVYRNEVIFMSNSLSNLSDEYTEKLYCRLLSLFSGMRMSNRELAQALNISEDVIEAWINKKRYPKVKQLGHIANVFGVSVDYLLCRTDDKRKITPKELKFRLNGGDPAEFSEKNTIDLSEFTKAQSDAIIDFCNNLKKGSIIVK